jgi:hypothetical protein
MSYDYDDEPREHECPRPLEEKVESFSVGGMFISPAGRWERITALSPASEYSSRLEIHTDKTGDGYCWQLWGTRKLPYVPGFYLDSKYVVAVSEVGSSVLVEATDHPRAWGDGHHLLSAQQVRGEGWRIVDCPDGKTVETATVDSKAKARTEVNRRAKAHAKRLGLPVWHKGDAS